MTKKYFARPKKREPGLGRIFFVLLVLVACLGCGIYFFRNGRSVLMKASQPDVSAATQVLEEARGLFSQGNAVVAATKLKPFLEIHDATVAPRVAILQADIDESLGNPDAALKRLEQAAGQYRASSEYPMLAGRYARQLEKAGRKEEARALYQSLCDNAPPEMRAEGLVGLGRLKETEGDLMGARDLYRSAAETAPWGGAVWNDAVDPLGKMNVKIIFSPTETPESKFYSVEKGDSITSIGNKLNTTQGLLLRANNLGESPRLSLGQRLKYTPKDFRIVVERDTCQMFLLDNRGLFKRYRVGLGMPGHETTPGKYTIGTKQKDPTWFRPGAGPITSGDPANELGTRWMPLVPAEPGLPTDLGLHGTIHPETIGQFSSHGCARMLNEDAEELYDLVVRSTPVTIVLKYTPDIQGVPVAPAVTPQAPTGQSAPTPAEAPAVVPIPATGKKSAKSPS